MRPRPHGSEQFARAPVNRIFDWTLRSRSNRHTEMALLLKPEYAQDEGVVHGGIITALADTAAVNALLAVLPANQTITSIEMKINFLRPVTSKGELVARSSVVRLGRRIALSDGELFQAGKLVAKGLFTYLVYARS